MSGLELYLSFVDSFREKIERIAIKKEKCRQAEYWRNMSPEKFEKEVGKWYLSQGYDNVKVTKPSKDGGVDIVLTKNDELTFVQCKHYKNRKVGEPECHQLGGTMLGKKVKKGIMVTLIGVTKQAKQYCINAHISIVTVNTLIRSNNEAHSKLLKSMAQPVIPFQSNLSTPFEEREAYGYYVYGKVFGDYDQAVEEMRNIPLANLTNFFDTKAIIKYLDHFFIIYSTAEKIKWLGWYVYRYLDANTGELVSPRSIQ